MGCLDDDDVLALVDQGTPDARRAALLAHLDGCPACRMLVAAVARTSHSESRAADEATTLPQLEAPVMSVSSRYPDLVAGDLVDRYRLDTRLGEGGVGVVWSATHVELGRRVAVKLLKSASREHAQRFLREARISASLRHPNVVEVYDLRELPGTDRPDVEGMVMIMELLEGRSLRAHLDQVGALARHEVGPVFRPLCEALAAAHALGVVHRDLKPDNVFLATLDGRVVPKILDFGLAKLTFVQASLDAGVDLTRSGALLGTPHYMAPEQIGGARDVDLRADVWSLGVMLWECLAGARPFEGRGYGPIFQAITTLPIPSLASVRPDLPAPLLELVQRMLERERASRPTLDQIATVLSDLDP
ncbi:MAG: serine/threonine protein kinase [Myxococcales bacterium]|nr:serine/threonine protein kinase [Myxococcales bacterium]